MYENSGVDKVYLDGKAIEAVEKCCSLGDAIEAQVE